MKFFSCLIFCLFLLSVKGVAQQATHKFITSDATSSENYQSMTFNGVWSWFSDPRAVYFEGKHKRTYAGWIDNYGDVHIGYYDHDTKQVASTVIYDNLEIDDHDNPTILVDDDGRLLVFFNTHLQNASPLYMRKTVNPEDISEWSSVKELFLNDTEKIRSTTAMHHTYTNPVRLSSEGGKIYLFWRGIHLKPSYAVSADNGETWSKGKVLFIPDQTETVKAPYTKVYSDGVSKIHFTFTDGHPTKEAKNALYYMYYENGAFYKANGQKIKDVSQLPILQSELDVIFKSDTVKSWNWDIAQDKKGNPIVTYAKFPDKHTHIYSYATFHNGQWKSYDLIAAGGWFPKTRKGAQEPEPHYAGGIVIDHETHNTVYLSVKRDKVFEIEQWTTNNVGKSWNIQKITENSSKDNVRPFAVRNAQKGNSIQLMWLQNTNYIYYAHDTRGKGIPIDFKDRYHTSVKMSLKKPEVQTKLTKENLKIFLQNIAAQGLENPDHSISKQHWEFGMFCAGIEAYAMTFKEERFKNEIVNLRQYFTQEDDEDEVEEETEKNAVYNDIWSFSEEKERTYIQQLEKLTDAKICGSYPALCKATILHALDDFQEHVMGFEALSKKFNLYSKQSLGEIIDYDLSKLSLRDDALVVYTYAKGIRKNLINTTYKETVINHWKSLMKDLIENKSLKTQQKLDISTRGAILLAGIEIFALLD